MNSESPMQSMHILPSRVFNTRGYPHLLWYAPSTMVLVLLSSKYRAPRYFDVAHTEDHKVPCTLVVSLTEYHGKWTRATPWCPVEYHVWRGPPRPTHPGIVSSKWKQPGGVPFSKSGSTFLTSVRLPLHSRPRPGRSSLHSAG